MTYNVFGGTLSLTQSINRLEPLITSLISYVCDMYRHTEACHGGRVSLVVLRCDTSADTADTVTAELSRRCAVGTCDGCHFVFLMRSRAACPLCTKQDFHTYKTLCVNGRRSVITDMITYVSVCISVSLSVSTKQDFHTYKTLCVNGRRSVITDMITYVYVCLFSLSLCLSLCLSVCLSLPSKTFTCTRLSLSTGQSYPTSTVSAKCCCSTHLQH